jgi:adenylyltransferase/sulfurtransferase
MNEERYARQIIYEKIGKRGQEKISAATVVIIGLGALGTGIADKICRSGVGRLRLIDSDSVELSNLPRQTFFGEADAAAGLPKAAGAAAYLSKINSEAVLEAVAIRADSSNIEGLIKDADVVLDGSDNLELRFILNEACQRLKIPWVYGGILGGAGSCMTIVPGGPCFRCLLPGIPAPGSYPTTSTAGVLNMAVGVIAAMEAVEAVKIITGSPDINRRLFMLDLWNNTAEYVETQKDPACPVCGG